MNTESKTQKVDVGYFSSRLLGQENEWALPLDRSTADGLNERLEAMFGEVELEAFKKVIKDCFREILEFMQTEIRLFLIQQDPMFLKIKKEIEDDEITCLKQPARIEFDPNIHTYGRMVKKVAP